MAASKKRHQNMKTDPHRAGRWPQVAVLIRQYAVAAERLWRDPPAAASGHALAAGGLERNHTDTFDRALAAQAMREGVPLTSKDDALAELPGLSVVW
jgi:hypothetical protein